MARRRRRLPLAHGPDLAQIWRRPRGPIRARSRLRGPRRLRAAAALRRGAGSRTMWRPRWPVLPARSVFACALHPRRSPSPTRYPFSSPCHGLLVCDFRGAGEIPAGWFGAGAVAPAGVATPPWRASWQPLFHSLLNAGGNPWTSSPVRAAAALRRRTPTCRCCLGVQRSEALRWLDDVRLRRGSALPSSWGSTPALACLLSQWQVLSLRLGSRSIC